MNYIKFGKKNLLELILILGISAFIVYNITYALGKFIANKENTESFRSK